MADIVSQTLNEINMDHNQLNYISDNAKLLLSNNPNGQTSSPEEQLAYMDQIAHNPHNPHNPLQYDPNYIPSEQEYEATEYTEGEQDNESEQTHNQSGGNEQHNFNKIWNKIKYAFIVFVIIFILFYPVVNMMLNRNLYNLLSTNNYIVINIIKSFIGAVLFYIISLFI